MKVLLKNSPRQLHIMLLRCVCGQDGTNWSDSEALLEVGDLLVLGCLLQTSAQWNYLMCLYTTGCAQAWVTVIKKKNRLCLPLFNHLCVSVNKSTFADGADCLLVIRKTTIIYGSVTTVVAADLILFLFGLHTSVRR